MYDNDPFADLKKTMAQEGANRRDSEADPADGAYPHMDYIPIAKVRVRGRKWEKEHKARTFRRISPNLQDDIRTLAKKEQLPIDDVANALLDYSLSYWRSGKLDLAAELSNYRRTLMPERGWDGKPRVYWLEQRWVPTPKRRGQSREKQMRSEQPWKDWPIIAYRLSAEVLDDLDGLRERLQVPVGEIVNRLFIYALRVYAAGNLVFQVEGEANENPETDRRLSEADWKPG